MSHLRTSGVRRAKRLPTVMQRKLATCQGTNGRTWFASQRSSLGISRDRTTSHCVNHHSRETSDLKDRRHRRRSSRQSAAPFAFLSILLSFVGNKPHCLGGIASRLFGNSTYAPTGAGPWERPISFLGEVTEARGSPISAPGAVRRPTRDRISLVIKHLRDFCLSSCLPPKYDLIFR